MSISVPSGTKPYRVGPPMATKQTFFDAHVCELIPKGIQAKSVNQKRSHGTSPNLHLRPK